MGSRAIVGLWMVAAALALEPAGPRAQQRPGTGDRAVPFAVGETLTYDVAWAAYLTAGTATVGVKARTPMGSGSAAYDLVAEGRPIGLIDRLYHAYYKAESLLDTRTLQSTMATFYADEQGQTLLRTTRFIGLSTIEFQPEAGAPGQRRTVPPLSQDPLSAIFVVRARALKAGQGFTMPVVDGSDIYQTRWQVAGPEPLTTPIGTLPAWRLTPALSDVAGRPILDQSITLWLSDDARRLPLKLAAGLPVGTFTLTLTRIGSQPAGPAR
jgi:Protein of unknown function (DUF3108)